MAQKQKVITMVVAISALLVVAAFLLYVKLAGGFDIFSSGVDPDLEQYSVRGIDISAHNGDIAFDSLDVSKVHFAYVKATEGTDFIDRKFHDNVEGLKSRGIATGAYHFFRFDTDGEMQARNFIDALQGHSLDLPPVIDIEKWGNPKGIPAENVINQLQKMLSGLVAAGYSPIIYTNKQGYYKFIHHHFDDYPLWICSFSDPPLPIGVKWDVWQYTHKGRVDGLEGDVDQNTINPSSPLNAAIDSIAQISQQALVEALPQITQ